VGNGLGNALSGEPFAAGWKSALGGGETVVGIGFGAARRRDAAPEQPSEAGGDLAVAPRAGRVASLWADAVPFTSVAPIEQPLHDSLRVAAGDVPAHNLDAHLRQQALDSKRAAALCRVCGWWLGETGLDECDDSDSSEQCDESSSCTSSCPCAGARQGCESSPPTHPSSSLDQIGGR
jgi:hypothetical protein